GLYLAKKEGDRIEEGEILARLYTCDGSKMDNAKKKLLSCYSFCEEKPVVMPLILAKVTAEGVERYDIG
ncbi:MAG: thymidine phosphorylase, partial [Lachnospiraceae bacterium]|nr:thymidine phosphorylase [Lachnospiraceae bacterium]